MTRDEMHDFEWTAAGCVCSKCGARSPVGAIHCSRLYQAGCVPGQATARPPGRDPSRHECKWLGDHTGRHVEAAGGCGCKSEKPQTGVFFCGIHGDVTHLDANNVGLPWCGNAANPCNDYEFDEA